MTASPSGLFVTGTDTDVGKTVAAAWLVRALNADYWKPVQCGRNEVGETDSETVARLAALAPDRRHPEAYCLADPVSPHEAVRRAGVKISLESITALPRSGRPVIVEGAGGALVPVNDHQTMIDVMAALGLPVAVVARPDLGTINHSLLTLEALRTRAVPVAGIIFSGPPEDHVRDAILALGRTSLIAELPRFAELTPTVLAQAAHDIPPCLTGVSPSLNAFDSQVIS